MYNYPSFFMFRNPLFPINYFYNYLNSNEDILDFLIKQNYYPIFKEAILASSKSLYDSLILFENSKINDARKLDQLKSGILKYFSRASTRATPYGYFAAVKIGHFSDSNNLKTDTDNKFNKSVRPDMEWIQRYIKNIEENISILPEIKVKFNSTAYLNGERLHLPYSPNIYIQISELNYKTKMNEDISIKYNSLIQFILKNLKEELEISKLVDKIKTNFQLNDKNKILSLLQDLINNGFIVTELKPVLGKTDILPTLISKLSFLHSQKDKYEYLVKLSNRLNEYSKMNIGEGIVELNLIINEMRNYYFVKNPLQIDICLNVNKQFSLQNEIAGKVKKVTEFLLSFSHDYNGFWQIREYHEEFINRYGVARELSIQELLDENIGLGSPANYKYPQSLRKIQKKLNHNEKILNYIFDKIIQTHFTDSDCIQITDRDLKILDLNQKNIENIPDSIEIYAQIFESKNCTKKKISLSGIQNTYGACPSFGRFTNIFSSKDKIELKSLVSDLELKYPDILFCELVYSPTTARSSNVALAESYWSYRLYLDSFDEPGKCNLKLNDIVVCADYKRFYFKSLKLQKEVVFVASHVLNFQNAPNIVRFMREVSYERDRFWSNFKILELSNITYIPRIEYEEIIISPKSWNLTLNSLRTLKDNFDIQKDFIMIFKIWKKTWNVPDFINITYADNRILLDIRKEFHIQEIKKELIRHEKLILQENLEMVLSECQEDKLIFSNEIVFPFTRCNAKKKSIEISERCNAIQNHRIFYPGSEWFYCKIYISNAREEEFISNYISEFIQEIKKEIEIESWFFIRFQDPKKHIRFRILLKDKNDYANLLKKFNYVIEALSKKGILNYSCIDSYEPEIERYGGPDLLPIAEKIFMFDSEIACFIIKNKKIFELNYSIIYICAFLSIDILDSFQLDYEDKLKWAEKISNKEKYIEEFRVKRKTITNLFIENNFNWFHDKIFNGLSSLICKRKEEILKFSHLLEKNISLSQIYNSKNMIISSFIHMQCIRILGVHKENEEKSNAFMLHILHCLKFHMMKKQNNSFKIG